MSIPMGNTAGIKNCIVITILHKLKYKGHTITHDGSAGLLQLEDCNVQDCTT